MQKLRTSSGSGDRQYPAIAGQTQRALIACLAAAGAVALAGCVSGKSLQDRHHMSRLWVDPETREILFEATAGPDYPIDSEAAEQERRRWMQQWLDRTDSCPRGFDVIDRVRIGDAADNPYQHDLRYTLRCKGV